MSEAAGEGFLSEVGNDIAGVAETGLHAAEAVGQAVTGNWEGAADSAQSMSEGALGVATGGISELAEAGWDAVAGATGLPSAHEAIHEGLQAAGNALGDGLESLVGDEHAHASAVDFDDGNYLAGIGEMATGAAETVGGAVESGLSSVGSAIGDMFGSNGAPSEGAADATQGATGGAAADDPSASYDPGADAAGDGSY
ncbi:MAG TPA: hypothetical protein VGS19_10320 [Streptosporangiaceae bacterium]|nr:hypothetical protein [Streptosporangiaceae bacterium]